MFGRRGTNDDLSPGPRPGTPVMRVVQGAQAAQVDRDRGGDMAALEPLAEDLMPAARVALDPALARRLARRDVAARMQDVVMDAIVSGRCALDLVQ